MVPGTYRPEVLVGAGIESCARIRTLASPAKRGWPVELSSSVPPDKLGLVLWRMLELARR